MTMARIEIEQYGHTWRAEVEGGPGMTARRRTMHAADFAEIIIQVVRAHFEINDVEPVLAFRAIMDRMSDSRFDPPQRERQASATSDEVPQPWQGESHLEAFENAAPVKRRPGRPRKVAEVRAAHSHEPTQDPADDQPF